MSSTKGPFCRSCGHQASPEANFCGDCGAPVGNPSDDNFVAFNDAELGPERGSFLTNYTDEQTALLRQEKPLGPGWYADPIISGWARKFDGQKWLGLQRRILTDAEKTDSDAASQTPATDPSPTSTDGTASGASASPGWYPDPGDSNVHWYWDGSAWTSRSPLQDSVAGKSGGLTGARGPQMRSPTGSRVGADPLGIKKWIIGGAAALLVLVGVAVAFGAIASQGQWRGLDPRIVSILDKDARADVWCRSLQINAVPAGLWTSLGRRAGMSSTAVQRSFYGFCGVPIPADDPGLGSDWVTQDLSKEIESYREICRPLVARGDYTSEADCLSHDGYLR